MQRQEGVIDVRALPGQQGDRRRRQHEVSDEHLGVGSDQEHDEGLLHAVVGTVNLAGNCLCWFNVL